MPRRRESHRPVRERASLPPPTFSHRQNTMPPEAYSKGPERPVEWVMAMQDRSARETATLAGGCFWCLEAVYDDLKGVESVVSGYMGGRNPNPTYEDVCGGRTG